MNNSKRESTRNSRRAAAAVVAILVMATGAAGASTSKNAKTRQIPVRVSAAPDSNVRIVNGNVEASGPVARAENGAVRVRVGAGASGTIPVDLGLRRVRASSGTPRESSRGIQGTSMRRPGSRIASPATPVEINLTEGAAPAPDRQRSSGVDVASQRSLYEQMLGDAGVGRTAPPPAAPATEVQVQRAPASAAFSPRSDDSSIRIETIPSEDSSQAMTPSRKPRTLPRSASVGPSSTGAQAPTDARVNGTRTNTGARVAGSTYRLGPGDVVDIFVWRNADLTREVPVRPDGRISMPLVGEVQAAGRTTDELRDDIVARLTEYIQVPEVSVSVSQINSLVVYVLGNVSSPGPQVLDRYANVLQALSMAGGLNEFADKGGITILRTVGGRQVRIEFDYADVVEGKNPDMNVQLQAGDIIYVP